MMCPGAKKEDGKTSKPRALKHALVTISLHTFWAYTIRFFPHLYVHGVNGEHNRGRQCWNFLPCPNQFKIRRISTGYGVRMNTPKSWYGRVGLHIWVRMLFIDRPLRVGSYTRIWVTTLPFSMHWRHVYPTGMLSVVCSHIFHRSSFRRDQGLPLKLEKCFRVSCTLTMVLSPHCVGHDHVLCSSYLKAGHCMHCGLRFLSAALFHLIPIFHKRRSAVKTSEGALSIVAGIVLLLRRRLQQTVRQEVKSVPENYTSDHPVMMSVTHVSMETLFNLRYSEALTVSLKHWLHCRTYYTVGNGRLASKNVAKQM